MEADDLRPYKSFLLATLGKPQDPKVVSTILLELQALVSTDRTQSMSAIEGPRDDPRVQVGFFTYVEHRPVSWARSDELHDVSNHLVLLCQGRGKVRHYVALFFSDNAVRDRAADRIRKREGVLGTLNPIPAGTMNAAYVRGQTQTLWLSGTHRRTSSKVDNKIISGLDLRYALDPLGDQTFFFTAAKSRVPGGKIAQAVGSSPRRSRLWVGPSQDWNDFSQTVSHLFDLLVAAAAPVASPLPVLASPVLGPADLNQITDAYDVALIPPELLDPSVAAPETIEERERLSGVAFAITERNGPNFTAQVQYPTGTELGSVSLEFALSATGGATWRVRQAQDAGRNPALFAEIKGALESRRGWLKVWYDSGHTLADEAFFLVRYRDQAFPDYLWENLSRANVTKEKPTPLSGDTIGAQDSLFCWVKNNWMPPGGGAPATGWLACDDGSMEKADFLHLDTIGDRPTLSLIHVKASKSADQGRQVSVADYEIVVGQAVKNLRYLDAATLGSGLAGAVEGRIKDKVWRNGRRASAPDFLKALGAIGTAYDRIVVILQPRATRQAVARARATPGSLEHQRLLQLDTLLLGARANCLALGARLLVIGEDTDHRPTVRAARSRA